MIEWNGDFTNLPPEDEPFTFRGNEYTWTRCNCGNPFCGRPEIQYPDGSMNFGMTARIRGYNQGLPMENIIAKFFGVEALAVAHETQETGPLGLWFDMIEQVEGDGKVNVDLLAQKDIGLEEYHEAKESFDEIGSSSSPNFQILVGNDALRFLEEGFGFGEKPGNDPFLS